MTARSTPRAALLVLAVGWATTGCFSSLLDSPCVSGYELDHGVCVPVGGADGGGTPDAATADADPSMQDGGGGGGDGGGGGADANSCTAPLVLCDGECVDLTNDPLNCGSCGHECASGICVDSMCVGDISGHIVAIGHDYNAHNSAMARLLGNALALGRHQTVAIGWWRGTASTASHNGAMAAGVQGLNAIGRPYTTSQLTLLSNEDLAQVDVLVIDAQRGNGAAAEATGTANAAAIDTFLVSGGVVVVLEGVNGVSYRLARGAALFDVAGNSLVTGQIATVVDGADAIAQLVVSPYYAATSSVTFTGAPSTVVEVGGSSLAFHLTR